MAVLRDRSKVFLWCFLFLSEPYTPFPPFAGRESPAESSVACVSEGLAGYLTTPRASLACCQVWSWVRLVKGLRLRQERVEPRRIPETGRGPWGGTSWALCRVEQPPWPHLFDARSPPVLISTGAPRLHPVFPGGKSTLEKTSDHQSHLPTTPGELCAQV